MSIRDALPVVNVVSSRTVRRTRLTGSPQGIFGYLGLLLVRLRQPR
ncbi:MAG: hypothetical protein H0V53_11995 [Rubrobacter sp.]|nr:hypothetical protein [Rubrobacter sp.]